VIKSSATRTRSVRGRLAIGLAATLGAGLIVGAAPQASAFTSIDLTRLSGTATDQYATTGHEGLDKAVDNSPYTKYFTPHSTTWLQYVTDNPSTVTSYTLTSGNDAPDRDPRNWNLQASNNGTSWTTLDSRSGETFPARFEKRTYSFSNTTAYRYYRLNITLNNGSPHTQLAEWALIGTGSGVTPIPAAPDNLTATQVSDDQIVVTWRDNSRYEQAFRLERSTDGVNWTWSKTLPVSTTRYHDLALPAGTTRYYRVRAENGTGNSAYTASVSATTSSVGAPTTWVEHWHDHTDTLNRVYVDSDVAIYFAPGFSSSATWLYDYVGDLWRYTKSNYGSAVFSNPRLFAVFHPSTGNAGHPATVYDASHDYRNVIDQHLSNPVSTDATARTIIAHELSHVVEFAASGVEGSPAFPIWQDSKWAEIFIYDAYVGTGMTADAARVYADFTATRDSFPQANTAWFRDWFYPIWRDYGQGDVLAAYFALLREHFHQHNGKFPSSLNWGEFVHFWSGAAGTNLKPLATTAFGWSTTWEQQFLKAQADFPGVTY
jgi:hypothetical protein